MAVRPFPIYDEICASLAEETTSVSSAELSKCAARIASLPKQHLEILYALVYHHALLSGDMREGDSMLPYGGKYIAAANIGITFVVRSLPVRLQHILARFIGRIAQ